MKICIVQCQSLKGKQKNLYRARKILENAKNSSCDLVVFPELYITGYNLEDIKSEAETIDGESIVYFKKLCKDLEVSVIFGFARKHDDKVFNTACCIDKNGKLVGYYDKTHLFGDENNYFDKGNEFKIFNTSFAKIGMLICYDIEFPEPSRFLSKQGVDFICCISANMKPYDNLHKMYIQTRAVENSTPVVYCNYVGKDEYFTYCGRSNIVKRNGKALFKFYARKRKLLKADLQLKESIKDSAMNYLANLREDLY